ncbi:MAG: amino acid ABC transporter substrate-binding protein [Parvibaculaceae bacterium]
MTIALTGLICAAAMSGTAGAAQSGTLETVQQRGEVLCGVQPTVPGFSYIDENGTTKGFDVDICRAVSAAVFGTDQKVKYVPLSPQERFTALQTGAIDILTMTTTWTFVRDANMGLDFAGISFYDGQGFMVRKDSGVNSVNDLDGAVICADKGTTNELNLGDYFRSHQLKYQPLVFDKGDETEKAYLAKRCDAYTHGIVGLSATLVKIGPAAAEHKILPEAISKDPLGPAVRQNDSRWRDIVGWSLIAMQAAEEYGITSQNVAEMRKTSTNPEIRRFLGADGELGSYLGISNDWAYDIIRIVGNYAESFERNIGPKTPLAVPRGQNALWKDGGLIYPPPFR